MFIDFFTLSIWVSLPQVSFFSSVCNQGLKEVLQKIWISLSSMLPCVKPVNECPDKTCSGFYCLGGHQVTKSIIQKFNIFPEFRLLLCCSFSALQSSIKFCIHVKAPCRLFPVFDVWIALWCGEYDIRGKMERHSKRYFLRRKFGFIVAFSWKTLIPHKWLGLQTFLRYRPTGNDIYQKMKITTFSFQWVVPRAHLWRGNP